MNPVDLCSIVNSCIRSVSPAQQKGWDDVAKTILSFCTLPFGILTFWLGYRQRESERRRGYYHKTVTEPLLPIILPFFDEQVGKLNAAGQQAIAGAASSRKTIPRSCSIALAEFGTKLFDMKDAITQRTAIFDEDVTSIIETAVEDAQDELTEWFNDINLHKRRNLPEIDQILRKHQRNIIRLLYSGNVKSF